MRFILKFAIVFVLVLSISLMYAAVAGDAKKGKDVFTKSCTQCHTEKGEVKPAIEKMFSVKMNPLGSKEIQSMADDQLQKVILEGKGKMKPVKLNKAEAADVVAFLRTLAAEKK